MPSTLINRNVVVNGHRTSVRLEPTMWEALAEIAGREGVTSHEICSGLARRRRESSLTAALRVFILDYFRAAATAEGHRRAGHGQSAGPVYHSGKWRRTTVPSLLRV